MISITTLLECQYYVNVTLVCWWTYPQILNLAFHSSKFSPIMNSMKTSPSVTFYFIRPLVFYKGPSCQKRWNVFLSNIIPENMYINKSQCHDTNKRNVMYTVNGNFVQHCNVLQLSFNLRINRNWWEVYNTPSALEWARWH